MGWMNTPEISYMGADSLGHYGGLILFFYFEILQCSGTWCWDNNHTELLPNIIWIIYLFFLDITMTIMIIWNIWETSDTKSIGLEPHFPEVNARFMGESIPKTLPE